MIYIIVFSILGGLLFFLFSGLIVGYFYTKPIAKKLYTSQWTRASANAFKRGCSDKNFDYHLDMFNQGMQIREKYLKNIEEVNIISLGDKLAGEYYNFGYDKAIILLPGRMETAYYGAYYVEPFKESGYNVLCVDPRAHGLSEGDKITLGKLESLDILSWSKFLRETKKVNNITLYGLCGGATACLLALKNKDCPSYINNIIVDGMFYSFYRLYLRHIKDEKKPPYPVIWTIMHLIKKGNDVNPYKMKPVKLIKDIHIPILFLSGIEDKFALPKEAKKMYELCPSNDKQLIYINNARHSHLRYDNKSEYDNALITFLKTH